MVNQKYNVSLHTYNTSPQVAYSQHGNITRASGATSFDSGSCLNSVKISWILKHVFRDLHQDWPHPTSPRRISFFLSYKVWISDGKRSEAPKRGGMGSRCDNKQNCHSIPPGCSLSVGKDTHIQQEPVSVVVFWPLDYVYFWKKENFSSSQIGDC